MKYPIGIQDFEKIINHGYLTIKEYDPMFGMYKLGFPNNEVREVIQDWREL